MALLSLLKVSGSHPLDFRSVIPPMAHVSDTKPATLHRCSGQLHDMSHYYYCPLVSLTSLLYQAVYTVFCADTPRFYTLLFFFTEVTEPLASTAPPHSNQNYYGQLAFISELLYFVLPTVYSCNPEKAGKL